MKRLPSYLLALLLVRGCANTSTTLHSFERADYLKEEMQYVFTSNTSSKSAAMMFLQSAW